MIRFKSVYYSFLTLVLLLMAGQAWGQSTRIYAEGFSIVPGESKEWEILFDGDVYITTAVVVVDIPEGFEFENTGTERRPVYAATTDVSTGLTIAHNLLNDGTQLRLVMTDNQQIGTDGTNGVLVKVNIKAKDNLEAGNYTFKLSELSVSDENEGNYTMEDQNVTVSVVNGTGIEDITRLNLHGSRIYDLQGRRINSQISTLNSQIKKGIYIVDGKKVHIM